MINQRLTGQISASARAPDRRNYLSDHRELESPRTISWRALHPPAATICLVPRQARVPLSAPTTWYYVELASKRATDDSALARVQNSTALAAAATEKVLLAGKVGYWMRAGRPTIEHRRLMGGPRVDGPHWPEAGWSANAVWRSGGEHVSTECDNTGTRCWDGGGGQSRKLSGSKRSRVAPQ